VSRLNKEQVKAQDPEIFKHWFKLYKTTCKQFNIKRENWYNIDKKGIIISYISKVKVIVSKYNKKIYMT